MFILTYTLVYIISRDIISFDSLKRKLFLQPIFLYDAAGVNEGGKNERVNGNNPLLIPY